MKSTSASAAVDSPHRWKTKFFLPCCVLAVIVACAYFPSALVTEIFIRIKSIEDSGIPLPNETCPQIPSLSPIVHHTLDTDLDRLYRSEKFKLRAYEFLGGAVRIPCESYDDLLPVGQDPRWDVFQDLHMYLEASFPRIYKSLKVTKVNTYGLVFHWQGSDAYLKPLLLAAHQDVVPVDSATTESWDHPPYSGDFDGIWIWGRGSADDKADLTAQLITIDALLQQDFKPRRTIVLAFGIDEEASGLEGAGKLAVYLESTYGEDSFALLLDEGEGYGRNARNEIIFATPGISEKGYFDAKIEVLTPGGHSSVPPPHTSIGLLSLIIAALERNPHDARFLRTGTAFTSAQCAAAYQENYPDSLRLLARRALKDDQALLEFRDALIGLDPVFGVMLQTTQAVDLVYGGVKINALPEVATAVVNHRIAEHSSTLEVQQHITELILPIAREFNLSVNAFGREIHVGPGVKEAGQVVLGDAFNSALEPSPVTPITPGSPYELVSGTIKATLESSERYEASRVVVSPSLGLGNTDTRFYWNLTRHIIRYSHRGDTDDVYNGLHTINEAVRGQSLIEQVRFFTKLILNMDETGLFRTR